MKGYTYANIKRSLQIVMSIPQILSQHIVYFMISNSQIRTCDWHASAPSRSSIYPCHIESLRATRTWNLDITNSHHLGSRQVRDREVLKESRLNYQLKRSTTSSKHTYIVLCECSALYPSRDAPLTVRFRSEHVCLFQSQGLNKQIQHRPTKA